MSLAEKKAAPAKLRRGCACALLALAVLLPAAAFAQAPTATATPAATPATVTPAPAPAAPAPAPARSGRTFERAIGPLVLAAGGLSLVVIDLVSLASVGPSADGSMRTVLDETTFGLNLLLAGLAFAAALVWWLMEDRPAGADASGGMVGAGDVI